MTDLTAMEKVATAMAAGEWHETTAPYWRMKTVAALQALREVDDATVEAMAAEQGWRGLNRTRDTANLAGRAFKSLLGCILSQTPNQGSER